MEAMEDQCIPRTMTTLAMVVVAMVVHTMAAMAVHSMAMVVHTMVAMAVHPMATVVRTMVTTAIQAPDPTWSVSHVLNAHNRLEAKDKGRATNMVTTMMMTIMAILITKTGITILITIPLATVTDTPTMTEATTTTIEPCPLFMPQRRIRLQEMGGSRRW